MSGKGDRYRSVDKNEYDRQFEAVFGKLRKHICREWVRDDRGRPICYWCGESQPIEPADEWSKSA